LRLLCAFAPWRELSQQDQPPDQYHGKNMAEGQLPNLGKIDASITLSGV
jgi:hypothetical protein